MAVKPWMGAIRNGKPTDFKPPKDNKAPKATLELEYCYGYRVKDTRNNLRYLKSGKIAYHAAALGIILDGSNNTQEIYNNHNDDITAIAFHPNGDLIATGELGKEPEI